ncbi:uncharacterized protein [Leptinotarsa decemlineata]|uniref:uncharacterized protein n=1 Tax=Leptinotarsa decemlineata TaxID=7539 RepID=UPI003D3068EF
MQNKKLVQKLTAVQRKMNVRTCSSYRTISAEAACVIAGVSPIEIQVLERMKRYSGLGINAARKNLMRRWQLKWRWTYRLIPNVESWVNRPYGEVDYYLIQALSGHGCFG